MGNELSVLEGYVGKVILVCYVANGVPNKEKGRLMHLPNKESFNIGRLDENGCENFHIVHFNQKTTTLGTLEEKLSAVALITNDKGDVLYKNDGVYENEKYNWGRLPLTNLLESAQPNLKRRGYHSGK